MSSATHGYAFIIKFCIQGELQYDKYCEKEVLNIACFSLLNYKFKMETVCSSLPHQGKLHFGLHFLFELCPPVSSDLACWGGPEPLQVLKGASTTLSLYPIHSSFITFGFADIDTTHYSADSPVVEQKLEFINCLLL